jgi:hypothetical protein
MRLERSIRFVVFVLGLWAFGCTGATRWHAPDADADADSDPDVDLDDDQDDRDPCPPPAESDEQVTTPVITTDPQHYIGTEITVVGTLFTNPTVFCNDLGPCGTCYPGLTLDGVITLRGPETGDELCGQPVGCSERVDSCLPHWDCWPFEIGRRVRARGIYRQEAGEPPEQPWFRLANGYQLELQGIEPIDPVSLSGLYEGTAWVGSIEGRNCGTFPNSFPIEVVVATSSEGLAVEFMSPGGDAMPMNQPIWPGWHTGQLEPESDTFTVTGMWPLGTFSGELLSGSVEGIYDYSLSGPDCRVTSTITVTQIH